MNATFSDHLHSVKKIAMSFRELCKSFCLLKIVGKAGIVRLKYIELEIRPIEPNNQKVWVHWLSQPR